MGKLFVAAVLCLMVTDAQAQSNGFNLGACARRLSQEVDRPFRLSSAQARARCSAIHARIDALSRRIVGTWTRRNERGQLERMMFLPSGVVHLRLSSYGTNRMIDEVRRWRFGNPYGTIGADVLEDIYPYSVAVAFSRSTMTIGHQPTSSQNAWSERWVRSRN